MGDGEQTAYMDLSDLNLTFRDALMVRFYRAMLIACFYSDVKVRRYAGKIESILEADDGS